MTIATKRINITFLIPLLEELKEYIPQRKRNQFIVETVEKELGRIRLQRALRESAGLGQMKIILIWRQLKTSIVMFVNSGKPQCRVRGTNQPELKLYPLK